MRWRPADFMNGKSPLIMKTEESILFLHAIFMTGSTMEVTFHILCSGSILPAVNMMKKPLKELLPRFFRELFVFLPVFFTSFSVKSNKCKLPLSLPIKYHITKKKAVAAANGEVRLRNSPFFRLIVLFQTG